VIAIYSNREWLPSSDCPPIALLYPAWRGELAIIQKEFNALEQYDKRFQYIFEIAAAPENADVLVIPADFKHYRRFNKLDILDKVISEAEVLNKEVLLFFNFDSDESVPINSERLIVFRTSFYKSSKKAREYALPGWSGDPLKEIIEFGIVQEAQILQYPSLSFCGQSGLPLSVFCFLKFARYILFKFFRPGEFFSNRHLKINFPFLRSDILRQLKRDRRLLCNFRTHRQYMGGAWLRKGVIDLVMYRRVREQYLRNLFSAVYVVCVRGGGNYSLRFFEAMAAGRIPVLFDTDCVLPFEDRIPWRNHIIWIDAKDLPHAADIVLQWHRSRTPAHIRGIMRSNRLIWERYLAPEGFFEVLGQQLLSEKELTIKVSTT
jgi:hypothetical protein